MSSNPFQPPAGATFDGGEYVLRPLRAFTIVVAIALSLGVLLLGLVALMNAALMEYDPGVLAGNDPKDDTSIALSVGFFLSSLGYLFFYIAGGILFCGWLLRASRNARALGAQGMEFTPGWTVGWFFVPFLNLIRPYEAVKELYQASDPDSGPTDWGAFEPPGFILAWWLSWIAYSVVGAAAQNFWNLPFVTVALAAVSATMAIRVLIAIDRRQAEKRVRRPAFMAAAEAVAPSGNRFL